MAPKATRLPTASVAELVSPWVMLHPSARIADAPMSSPPAKSWTRLQPGGSFHLNSPAGQAPRKAPMGTPTSRTMLQLTRFGYPTSGEVSACPVLLAKVIPAGASPKDDVHQPSAISTPTAMPVAGHGHFPCSGSPPPRHRKTTTTSPSTAITTHGERA